MPHSIFLSFISFLINQTRVDFYSIIKYILTHTSVQQIPATTVNMPYRNIWMWRWGFIFFFLLTEPKQKSPSTGNLYWLFISLHICYIQFELNWGHENMKYILVINGSFIHSTLFLHVFLFHLILKFIYFWKKNRFLL